MEKLEKRKNTLGGIIMYSLMILTYFISCIRYVILIAKHISSVYTYSYMITDAIIFVTAIVALIVMLVRKRQSGFGVALPMIAAWIVQLGYIITYTVVNAHSLYAPKLRFLDILPTFVFITIVLVVVFFFVPNKVMRAIAASVVGLSAFIRLIIFAINLVEAAKFGYLRADFLIATGLWFMVDLILYGLIIVQIFLSFKAAAKQPATINQPYAYAQATVAPTAAPAPQPIPKEQILANYQNLLNQGLITQEQFEAKKNELQ